MRLFLNILFIAALAGLLELFFPWWVLAIGAFIVALCSGLNAGRGFLAGFLGIFFLWLVVALFRDQANDHHLSQRMAVVFKLPGGYLLMVISALIGGIVGGLSGWAGVLVRRVIPRC